jgi:hypothetical protein
LIARLHEPDDLPEGPDVVISSLPKATPAEVEAEVGRIIAAWTEIGYCRAEEVLILHTRTDLQKSALGGCRELAGLPLIEYGTAPEPGKKAIRHLSINRAKGLDAVAVIVVGVAPFASLTRIDDQYTYFMGASRAKQLLAVVEGA